MVAKSVQVLFHGIEAVTAMTFLSDFNPFLREDLLLPSVLWPADGCRLHGDARRRSLVSNFSKIQGRSRRLGRLQRPDIFGAHRSNRLILHVLTFPRVFLYVSGLFTLASKWMLDLSGIWILRVGAYSVGFRADSSQYCWPPIETARLELQCFIRRGQLT